ncbi:M43 family zinc metalloprotease [Cytophagaceae bacterium ABcell3]|nr:M43 family zinc metalloprotease [Cytophagaceae bacterium ABcell3]
MHKKLIFLLAALFIPLVPQAQDMDCPITSDMIDDTVEEKVQQYLRENINRKSSEVYKIPVVIHVLYRNGREEVGVEENITDYEIYKYLEELNNQLRKVPGSSGDGNGVDTRIEVVLATKDPEGIPTSGINRVNASSVPHFNTLGYSFNNSNPSLDNTAAIRDITTWDRTKYLNIYLAWGINYNGGFYAGLGGTFGAAMQYNTDPKTWTHEIGHCFGLLHTFEDGCNEADCETEGDRVCDTPPTTQNAFSGNMGDCIGASPCGTTAQIRNYMDYSLRTCRNKFTAGQMDRMHAFLENPWYVWRTIWQPENLVATGTDGRVAPKITFFDASTNNLCIRDSVSFSFHATRNPTTWQWEFEDGNPASSNSREPAVAFLTPGKKKVTLTLTNDYGEDILSKEEYIEVYANEDITVVSDTGDVGDTLRLVASGAGNIRWFDSQTSVDPVFTGDTFTTPALDETLTYYAQAYFDVQPYSTGKERSTKFSSGTGGYILFDVHHPLTIDSVKIFARISPVNISIRDKDNRVINEWVVDTTIREGQFLALDQFLPVGEDYRLSLDNNGTGWLYFDREDTGFPYTVPDILTLKASIFGQTNRGDYLYFYDWHITALEECPSARIPVLAKINQPEPEEPEDQDQPDVPVAVKHATEGVELSVIPNPFSTRTCIKVESEVQGNLKIKLLDNTGKVVSLVHDGKLNTGTNEYYLERKSLTPGMYYMIAEINDLPAIQKVVVY